MEEIGVFTVEIITDQGEELCLKFYTESDAIAAATYLKQCSPINLGEINIIKPFKWEDGEYLN